MFKEFFKHPGAFLGALLVHAVLAGLLVFSLDWSSKPVKPPVRIVNAVVVDAEVVEARMEEKKRRLEEEEQRKQREEQVRLDRIKEEEQAAQRKREEEKRRAAEVERKRVEEQREAEAERSKKLNAEKEAERKRAEEKRLAEKEAKRKIEGEKRRKTEEEAKRKAEEARRREAEQAIKDQLAAEQREREQAQREREARATVEHYVAIIQQRVTRSWIRPLDAKSGLSCVVRVRLIPGGEVADARVVRSSGDPQFDRSVETAVFKASPLPLPPDTALFERFRELQFIFKPEG